MKQLKYDKTKYGDIFVLSEEEKKAIRDYQGEGFKLVNSLLTRDGGNYEGNLNSVSLYQSPKDIETAIQRVSLMYSAMLKSSTSNYPTHDRRLFHRGTSGKEIRSLKTGEIIGKPLSTANDEKGNWQTFMDNNPKDMGYLRVRLNPGILTIDMAEVLDYGSNWERETLISPFTRVSNIRNGNRRPRSGSYYEVAEVELEPIEMEALDEIEETRIREEIIGKIPRMRDFVRLVNVERGRLVEEIENKRNMLTNQYFLKEKKEAREKLEKAREELDKMYAEGATYDLAELEKVYVHRKEEFEWYRTGAKKELEELEEKLHKMDEQIQVDMAEFHECKSNFAKLCMSACKKKEIELEQACIGKEEDFEKQEEAKRQAEEEKRKSEESKKREQEIVKQRMLREDISKLYALVAKSQTATNPTPFNKILSLKEYNKWNKNNLRNLGCGIYESPFSRTLQAVERMQRMIQLSAKLTNESEIVEPELQEVIINLKNGTTLLNTEAFSQECMEVLRYEENLVKKVAFDNFAKIAMRVELDSLERESVNLRQTAERKKGPKFLRGVRDSIIKTKSHEEERADRIDNFLVDFRNAPKKQFINKTYSVRNILADMEIFLAMHQGDERYCEQIREVERIKSTLSGFRVPAGSVEKVVAEKKQRMAESGQDKRNYFLIDLYNNMEAPGIPNNRIRTPQLDFLQQQLRMDERTIAEVEWRREHANHQKGLNMARNSRVHSENDISTDDDRW